MYRFLSSRPYKKKTIKYKNHAIRVEIADTMARGAVGLMYRESIGKDEGMLFVFPMERQWKIWMLNMRFPLDIVWMDRSGSAIYIEKNLKPCTSFFSCDSYAPEKGAKYVLELAAGSAARLGIRVGDRLKI